MNDKRNWSCLRKKRYTKKKAHEQQLKLEEKGIKDLNTYRCKHCRGFHIGHTPLEIRKKRRPWEYGMY